MIEVVGRSEHLMGRMARCEGAPLSFLRLLFLHGYTSGLTPIGSRV
jgi:hypothetical protein